MHITTHCSTPLFSHIVRTFLKRICPKSPGL